MWELSWSHFLILTLLFTHPNPTLLFPSFTLQNHPVDLVTSPASQGPGSCAGGRHKHSLQQLVPVSHNFPSEMKVTLSVQQHLGWQDIKKCVLVFFSLCLSRFFAFVLLPVLLYFSFTPFSVTVVKREKNTKYLKASILKSGKKNRSNSYSFHWK